MNPFKYFSSGEKLRRKFEASLRPVLGDRLQVFYEPKTNRLMLRMLPDNTHKAPIAVTADVREFDMDNDWDKTIQDLIKAVQKAEQTINDRALDQTLLKDSVIYWIEGPSQAALYKDSCPNIPFLEEGPEMPRLFFRAFCGAMGGNIATILITNAHCRQLGLTTGMLKEWAEKNLNLFHPIVTNMENMIKNDPKALALPWNKNFPCIVYDENIPRGSSLLMNTKLLDSIAEQARVNRMAILPLNTNYFACGEVMQDIAPVMQADLMCAITEQDDTLTEEEKLFHGLFFYDRRTQAVTASRANKLLVNEIPEGIK